MVVMRWLFDQVISKALVCSDASFQSRMAWKNPLFTLQRKKLMGAYLRDF
jgi:hypothetical protein